MKKICIISILKLLKKPFTFVAFIFNIIIIFKFLKIGFKGKVIF